MNKVYIVTNGEYDDYHVVGVFASREDADALVEKLNWRDGAAGVEVRPLLDAIPARVQWDIHAFPRMFPGRVWTNVDLDPYHDPREDVRADPDGRSVFVDSADFDTAREALLNRLAAIAQAKETTD